MTYRANKKVSRWRRHQQDPHQKQYVPLPFGGGHNKFYDCLFEIRKIAGCFLWLSLLGDYRVTDEALLAEIT